MPWLDVAIDYLECAMSGIGCDETMIIDTICLATAPELDTLHHFLNDPKTANSHAIVNSKKLIGNYNLIKYLLFYN